MVLKYNINDILVPKSKKDIITDLKSLSQEKKDQKLRNASYNGQLEVVKLLIEAGANVNANGENGYTALITASSNGRLDIVKYLIESNADINVKNKYGETALTWALYYNYKDIVKLLNFHNK